jgi:endonuclease YncB( thermonuclease family)
MLRRVIYRGAIAAGVAGLFAGSSSGQAPIVGPAAVTDGDTIVIRGERIRIEGIDAPESGQPCTRADGTAWRCGQVAALELADKVGLATVRCEPHGHDRYGRALATCSLGGEDLGRWLVYQGLAVAYRRFSSAYVEVEDEARRAKRGIWAGTFTLPEDWRAARR